MTKRKCRNPHNNGNLTMEQIITLAMDKLGWPRAKCLSWYEKENASLKHARPRELMERGQTNLIEELLNKREKDRKKEDKKREDKKNENKE